MKVEPVETVDRELVAAVAGLLPQLSASRTPPSTVTEQPVVFAERSDARNSTASATSSGRIPTPSRLRLR